MMPVNAKAHEAFLSVARAQKCISHRVFPRSDVKDVTKLKQVTEERIKIQQQQNQSAKEAKSSPRNNPEQVEVTAGPN